MIGIRYPINYIGLIRQPDKMQTLTELRKERREQQMKKYEEQQKMIAETKDFIERFKGTYSKTFQVQC